MIIFAAAFLVLALVLAFDVCGDVRIEPVETVDHGAIVRWEATEGPGPCIGIHFDTQRG